MPSIGPLVAYPLTPRGDDGRLLNRSFEQLVDGAITHGATAIGVLGSTGGSAYMPRTMRKRIARTAVAVADGRVPVLVGVGALSTAEVIANLAEAHAVGVDGALLQPMAYQSLTFDEIYGLFRDAASASEIPLWVYNNPGTTGHRFSVEELVRLARIPGVVGFKDTAANGADVKDRIARITESVPQRTAKRLSWGFSGDGLGAQILLSGASSWHSGMAGVIPEICGRIATAATSGNASEARTLQRQLTPLSIIVRQYGGIRVAHSVAEMRGLDVGTLPRPLLPLPADARTLLRMAFVDIDLTAPSEVTDEAQEQAVPATAPQSAPALPADDSAVEEGPTGRRRASTPVTPPRRARTKATPVTDDDDPPAPHPGRHSG